MVFVVYVYEFGFDFVVDFQELGCVVNVFVCNVVSGYVVFDVVSQFDGSVFGVYFFDYVFDFGIFWIGCYVLVEWILFQLFDVQVDVFVFWIDGQDYCVQGVVFFEVVDYVFVGGVLVDV